MQLGSLPKTKAFESKKRVGRGHSSGKGKTSGRGQKGQKARNKVRLGFEGGQTPLYKRVPMKRGKGMKKTSIKPFGINLSLLATFPAKSIIDAEAIIKAGLVSADVAKRYGLKILGAGELPHQLTIALPISQKAQAKVEQAGGNVLPSKVTATDDEAEKVQG